VESMKHLLLIVHCLSRLLSCKYGPPPAHTYNNSEVTIVILLIIKIIIHKSPQHVVMLIFAFNIKDYNECHKHPIAVMSMRL
jgi:hypothetical protein